MILAALPAVVIPVAAPTACVTHACCGSCGDESAAATEDNSAAGHCQSCNNQPIANDTHNDEHSPCPCSGLCASPQCAAAPDGGLIWIVPLAQVHAFPPSLHPSDHISEEPEPPHTVS